MIQIRPANSKKDFQSVKDLFREYAESLGFDLDFQNFEDEMRGFPGKYAPPEGAVLVAESDGTIVGCVALRALSAGCCEMKRLYVKPDHRGLLIGARLTKAIIIRGREDGYDVMRLDTVPWMKAAINLYRSLGFKPIPAYCHNPIDGALFFELDLRKITPV